MNQDIEKKWQEKWENAKIFQANVDEREKYYIAIVYPYMSGLLHLGHLFTYATSEVLMRYKRMKGFNVHAKFGFHCTGTPIVAAADRVKEGEKTQIDALIKMGIKESEIPKFADPIYWINYFPRETLKDIKKMGFSIDTRYSFRTTSINPPYDAMIKWQFNKLKEKDLVKKGKHPVVWCPKDNLPVGDHDRAEGEGETPQEYLLFKHKLDDGRYLISATLRQDTVMGITNLFIHPDFDYKETIVNGETWILGDSAIERLKEQDFEVKIKSSVKGKEFIGKYAQEYGNNKVMILPATFLNPNFGTGLVHSVPSDSADDLIALRDLQNDEETCNKYNLDINKVREIKPISVLNTPEYGDFAADAILKKYNVKSQNEREKLEAIKKELYKISHHTATLNHKYKDSFSVDLEGKKVEEAKEIIKKELVDKGYAVPYYELTGKVVCRCLTPCIIKVVSDQWFIEYNDPEWKKLAHKALDSMKIYPEKLRRQFDYVLDWLNHWACTRESGLGTRLPWDQKWMIESLSDSTIQMAYATISKYLEHPEEYNFNIEKLNDEFFDYVFLGKGDAALVAKSTEIPQKMVEKMREDFNYWYPFDFRNSAKDLMQNHLSFSIFNHTALFPPEKWPKAFLINGRIMVNNEKMSKSKGNFFTMRELYEKHGADVVRLTAVNAGEGADDANFDMSFLDTSKKKLHDLFNFIKENYNKGREDYQIIDEWFESKINEAIKNTTNAYEEMMFKSGIQFSMLDLQRHLKWYLKRTNGNPNKQMITKYIETILKLMAPVTPHFCEECWEIIGNKNFISTEKWLECDESKINPDLDNAEELIKRTYSDIRTVMELAKLDKLNQVKIIVSPKWKYGFYSLLKEKLEETRNGGEIIKGIMQTDYKQYGQEITKVIPAVIKDSSKLPSVILGQEKEMEILLSDVENIKQEFSCDVVIEKAEESKEKKQGLPAKPAIVVN